ncbi:hypothetical protein D9613_007946 [Agrocybe pediades]|uniref:Uncharacterized protein n=1 Tax=Agrocybe pediades TaxID=84607 RepID=A0A8H4QNF6_9AGAR|nr:hypothetical protein D9613_007946 [Agrocybe pediades]
MPQIYTQLQPRHQVARRRSSSSSSHSSSSSSSSSSNSTSTAVRPTDADESIVLSDLVRSGEASRLRRRGAMRMSDRPDWGVQYDFDFATGFLSDRAPSGQPSTGLQSGRRSVRRPAYVSGATEQDQGQDEYVYALTCGAPVSDCDWIDDAPIEPFKPSILPLFPRDEVNNRREERREPNRSTGCGSLIHRNAAPRPRVGIWSACTPAEACVVQLDAEYFDTKEAARFTRSACGCVKEGIGCAVCGNPLGTRYIPCKSAADTFLCSRSLDKSLTHFGSHFHNNIDGTSSGGQSSKPRSDRTVCTFFSNAVSSSPAYQFPPSRDDDLLSSTRVRRGLESPELDMRLFAPLSTSYDDYFSEDDDDDGVGLHMHGLDNEDYDLSSYLDATYDNGDGWYSYSRPPLFSANESDSEDTNREGLSPASRIFVDRVVTASPSPLSEADPDETQRPHSQRVDSSTSQNTLDESTILLGADILRPSSAASSSSSGSSTPPTFAPTASYRSSDLLSARYNVIGGPMFENFDSFGAWTFQEQAEPPSSGRTTRNGRGRSRVVYGYGYDGVYARFNADGTPIDENFGFPTNSQPFDPDGNGEEEAEVWGTTSIPQEEDKSNESVGGR